MRENNHRKNAVVLFVIAVIVSLIIPVKLPADQKAVEKENRIIVLAMHGTPPNDFPKDEAAHFFRLHSQLHSGESTEEKLKRRYDELEDKMRNWPRTAQNDPFFVASQNLGAQLKMETGYEVIVGFNEFCAPSLDDAFDQAVEKGASKIIVVTAMMVGGGKHSEVDIPAAIKRAQNKYPRIKLYYVWPYEPTSLAQFMDDQIKNFFKDAGKQ
jgi:sirohydrochlorin cobaltochelatase